PRSSDLQLGDVVGGQVAVSGGLDCLAGGFGAVDDHGDRGDLGSGLAQRLAGGQHAAAGGGGVLHGHDPAAGDIGAFDASLQAMGFVGFAHHEGVQRPGGG